MDRHGSSAIGLLLPETLATAFIKRRPIVADNERDW